MAKLQRLHEFLKKADAHSLRVAVIGLGYVGLPLLLRFSEVGFPVIGIDRSASKVDLLQRGQSPLRHIPAASIQRLAESGHVSFTADHAAVAEAQVVIFCVPTPLTARRQPDLGHVTDCADAVMPHVHPGQLLVLGSTVYPGATEEVFIPRLASRRLTPGENMYLAYSPERADPGNPKFSACNTPRVCGGMTSLCGEMVARLYSRITDQVVLASSIRVAEMSKLLENVHRAVNIALVNEMKKVADRMDIDIHEVIAAAATKPFGFTPFHPGPGLGGHCIPIDPLYLTWKAREFGARTPLIEVASEVNAGMPDYVVGKVVHGLNRNSRSVRGSRILVCGLAYKKNVDDVRGSPAIDIVARLVEMGGDVAFSDSYVADHSESGVPSGVRNVPCSAAALAAQDCVVIATDHDYFDYELIQDTASLVVDTRGRYRRGMANVVCA